MKSITQTRSLGDMRTSISAHARSAPRQGGSTYLEVYLLDKEKQRLETELAVLDKRQKRIEGRLGEIRQAVEGLLNKAEQKPSASVSGTGEGQPPEVKGSDPRKWRTMTVRY